MYDLKHTLLYALNTVAPPDAVGFKPEVTVKTDSSHHLYNNDMSDDEKSLWPDAALEEAALNYKTPESLIPGK